MARENDIQWVTKYLPSSVRSGSWYMIENPLGYGKSALMSEWAFKRTEVSKMCSPALPSGPVLFTDFRNAASVRNAEQKIMKTVEPLFIPTIFSKWSGGGIISSPISIFTDNFEHSLKLVQEVSLELSEGKHGEKVVVVWILDSFSKLMSNALSAKAKDKHVYSELFGQLFDLSSAMVPVPVCSSITPPGALSGSTFLKF